MLARIKRTAEHAQDPTACARCRETIGIAPQPPRCDLACREAQVPVIIPRSRAARAQSGVHNWRHHLHAYHQTCAQAAEKGRRLSRAAAPAAMPHSVAAPFSSDARVVHCRFALSGAMGTARDPRASAFSRGFGYIGTASSPRTKPTRRLATRHGVEYRPDDIVSPTLHRRARPYLNPSIKNAGPIPNAAGPERPMSFATFRRGDQPKAWKYSGAPAASAAQAHISRSFVAASQGIFEAVIRFAVGPRTKGCVTCAPSRFTGEAQDRI